MVFLLCFLPSAPVPPRFSHQPAISGTLRSSRRRPETRHLSSIKSLKGPRAGLEGGREAGGLTVVPEGIHSPEVPRPARSLGGEGPECGGGKGERSRGGGKISLQSFVFLIGSNAPRRTALLSWPWGWTRSKRQASGGRQCGLQEALACPSPGG